MARDPKPWSWLITAVLMLAAIGLAILAVVNSFALMFGTF